MNTNELNISPKKWILILVAAVIVVALGWVANRMGSAEDAAVSKTAVAKQGAPNRATSGASKYADYNTSSGVNVSGAPLQVSRLRPATGKIEKDRFSYWWLYAQSEEEARWLDFYGYPTPAEEAQLRAMSDADLKAMADIGNLNAKTHVVARKFTKALVEGNIIDADNIIRGFDSTAVYAAGGGYQGMTMMQAYAKALDAYYAIPELEKTAAQRKFIEDGLTQFNDARAYAVMFDDYEAEALGQLIGESSGYLHQRMIDMDKGRIVISFLRSLPRYRQNELGLPPLVIQPRPRTANANAAVYYDRY